MVWNAQDGTRLDKLTGQSERILHAAWDPGGARIVLARGDGTAHVWDVDGDAPFWRLPSRKARKVFSR